MYDQFGHNGPQGFGSGAGGNGGYYQYTGNGFDFDMGDIFSSVFLVIWALILEAEHLLTLDQMHQEGVKILHII